MPNPPFRVTPIPDRDDLLAFIRDSIRTNTTRAIDGLRDVNDDESLHPRDALSLIHPDLQHTLAVVKASKELI